MSSPPATSLSFYTASQRTDSPLSTQDPTSRVDSTVQDDAVPNAEKPSSPRWPLRIYTRQQLLSLSQSPMVKPPPDMPELKTWFGVENENLINKKDEPSAPNSARERRFRRDAEEGDIPPRPTFRSTLQPSQMGNFKHQSLRERDRDREGERERDMRDKDGHERLRHLSDKYDRDRLLPLSSTRHKDRDPAPHVNSSTARGQQSLPANSVSRRTDTREPAKKKVAETNEDWRRDPRSAREERLETNRRDREDRERERARSRPRDSSGTKRETSISRRDRDRDEPRERARDRDRDEHRRESSRSRRDRDEDDDARHWRDDGKRGERMAARRERARAQDRESDDRRWTPGDDRDGARYKRNAGRERKPGTTGEDPKDKEDRQKEKEPAWMDTYIPNELTSGILGGQAPNGELDGIQAWKKGLKEKEREKEVAAAASSTSEVVEQPLDEIQIFRMLMKKEEDKKRLEEGAAVAASEQPVLLSKNEDVISHTSSQQNATTNDSNGGERSVQSKSSLTSLNSFASVDTSSGQSISLKDPAVLSSVKLNSDGHQELAIGLQRESPSSLSTEFTLNAPKPPVELPGSSAFPPVGSRVLAMKNKAAASSNAPLNLQSLNGGVQSIIQESPQLFVKNDSLRPHPGFSPFDDASRPSYEVDDSRDLSVPLNQGNVPQRLPIEQLFHNSTNAQVEANYNNSLNKGSRLAKIFENKSRDVPVPPSKPSMQGSYISPAPSQNQRQELGSFGGVSGNSVHSLEELVTMLNNSSQRNPQSTSCQLLNNNFNNHLPNLHPLQQQHVLQQQLSTSRLEPLYESRTEDRSFVPDGMVPGLRTAPPPAPRRESLGHFNDPLDEPLHYNLQRLSQQHQVRNIDQLFNGPNTLFNQQTGRPGGGLPLQSVQQPQYRGGPSPALNPTGNAQQQQRLPPGLANLGGRPPHDPSQFLGLSNLPSLGPQHSVHGNGPLPQQQLPFNNFNASNNIGLNNPPSRGPGQSNLLQNSGGQQLPLGNLGHHSLDPRLSNHHHLMGIGGSGINGNRMNSIFPPQQQPNAPGMRPQQQQQQLPPHMLPHLMPPHMQQQGHPPLNNPQGHDLMAVLMGGPHRE